MKYTGYSRASINDVSVTVIFFFQWAHFMSVFKITGSSLCGCVGGSAKGAAGGSKDVVWETHMRAAAWALAKGDPS